MLALVQQCALQVPVLTKRRKNIRLLRSSLFYYYLFFNYLQYDFYPSHVWYPVFYALMFER